MADAEPKVADAEPKEPPKVDAEPKATPDSEAKVKALERELNRVKNSLKEKLDAEEKAKQAALEEQGKFREVAEALKKEIDPLKTELEKYREQEKRHRAALIEKLPEEKRALYADVPTAVLADLIATVTEKPYPTRPSKAGTGDDDKAWEAYTFDELATMQWGDPQKWSRLRDDYMKRKGLKLR